MAVTRMSDDSADTAGGTIGLTNTPSSSSAQAKRKTFSSFPSGMGIIGVGVAMTGKPRPVKPSLRIWAFFLKFRSRCGA